MAERPCRIAYLGRLEPYKRVDLLLRAVAARVPRFPELELVVVGRGAEGEALAALASELGIAARVRFTGFVSNAERDASLAKARVCVCPSLKEGWGITVVEANALGVPVVATDAPGLRDAVRRDKTGLLVPDGPPERFVAGLVDALSQLLPDEPRLSLLSQAAVEWARRFDWDTSARKMAETIEAAR
jgi:glycosyltransferase involved in cell wall biosynthesis